MNCRFYCEVKCGVNICLIKVIIHLTFGMFNFELETIAKKFSQKSRVKTDLRFDAPLAPYKELLDTMKSKVI